MGQKMRRVIEKWTVLCTLGIVCCLLLQADMARGVTPIQQRFRLSAWVKSGFGLMAFSRDIAAQGPAQPTASPAPSWQDNIVPHAAGWQPTLLAWQYRPLTLDDVPDGVTVLAPTWYYVEDDEGEAALRDLAELGYSKWDPAGYTAAAREKGIAVWATAVSFTPALSKQVVTDADKQAAFITRMVQEIEKYHLDGINFDFEKMDPADASQYTAFIAACKAAFPANVVVSVCVTVPLPYDDPGNWYQCYDRGALAQVCDYVAVMTYDAETEPVAPYGWVEEKLQATLASVPSDKLLMGFPFYGREYTAPAQIQDDGSVSAGSEKPRRESVTPARVNQLLAEDGYDTGEGRVQVKQWLDKGAVSDEWQVPGYRFIDTQDNLHRIWMDDAASMALKAQLVQKYQLAGGAVWRLASGQQQQQLWPALTQGMTP
ncbi:MAG: glycosyl hydrolase family 18 protein [Eubacteriales bacterium]|nr:glycosyl hydrolase family 18 protein [Eubacteriales bacterium]